jgi:hypothetical protein
MSTEKTKTLQEVVSNMAEVCGMSLYDSIRMQAKVAAYDAVSAFAAANNLPMPDFQEFLGTDSQFLAQTAGRQCHSPNEVPPDTLPAAAQMPIESGLEEAGFQHDSLNQAAESSPVVDDVRLEWRVLDCWKSP